MGKNFKITWYLKILKKLYTILKFCTPLDICTYNLLITKKNTTEETFNQLNK